jgi:hypothetical protein
MLSCLQRTQVSERQEVNWPGQMLRWADFGFAQRSPLATMCCLRRSLLLLPLPSLQHPDWFILRVTCSHPNWSSLSLRWSRILHPYYSTVPPPLMDNVVTLLLACFLFDRLMSDAVWYIMVTIWLMIGGELFVQHVVAIWQGIINLSGRLHLDQPGWLRQHVWLLVRASSSLSWSVWLMVVCIFVLIAPRNAESGHLAWNRFHSRFFESRLWLSLYYAARLKREKAITLLYSLFF